MSDRRRINGPPGGTAPPIFQTLLPALQQRPRRERPAAQPRKIFLQTGLTPSASGSAYLELEPSSAKSAQPNSLIAHTSTLKITCAVHGPRPLPRSAPFSSQLILTTNVKFAPFASRQRRGFIRDASERDLGAHLETALRGVIIGDRWPKSGVEVVVTILEAEDNAWWADEQKSTGNASGTASWGMLTVLAGCITVASAALVSAGIDCVDLVSGGVAAVVRPEGDDKGTLETVLDPCPAEHKEILAACVVGYLRARDEITELWSKGDFGQTPDRLMDKAVEAAVAARSVLIAAITEATQPVALDGSQSAAEAESVTKASGEAGGDVEMDG